MILILLIGAHFLADFTLQPTRLAVKKNEKAGFLLLHAAIYAAVMAIVGFLAVEWRAMLFPYGIIALSHWGIDQVRVFVYKRRRTGAQRFGTFAADQLLHLAVITAVYFAFDLGDSMTYILRDGIASETVRTVLIWAVMLVVIWDPTSVFVRKLFNCLDNTEGEQISSKEPRAGSLIGKLERLIIVILVMVNQIGGIGFVLTAKSVARFKQLEDRDFAEKYLVGTLTSASVAILTALILRRYI